MKKICLSLLISASISPFSIVYAQESPEEIRAQIESLEKLLVDMENEARSLPEDSRAANSKDFLGKRSNPIPLGEFFEVVDSEYGDDGRFEVQLNLRIMNIIRGEEAYNILLSENQFNQAAPKGLEWAIFDLEAEYIKGSEDYPYSPYILLNIFDTNGKQVSQSFGGMLDSKFSYTSIFPGLIHSGREAYLVPEDEDFLISMKFDKLYFFNNK